MSILDHVEDKILKALEKANHDLSVLELAELTGVERHTVAKYIFALERTGRVEETRRLGRTRLYRIAKKE